MASKKRKHSHSDSPSEQDSAPSTSSISRDDSERSHHSQTESPTEPETEQPKQGSSGTAGAAPEDIFIPFIEDVYPNLLTQTYFHPPLYFSRAPHDVVTIAGQTALVRENPRLVKGYRKLPPHPPPAQVAGRVYLENPPNIHPVHSQSSDQVDDRDQQRCLQALSLIPHQVMMVVSTLRFQNYLSNHPNPHYAAAIAQLPSIQHPSIPAYIADGECDIVIIHRQYGLIIGEVKSTGGNPYFHQLSPGQQSQLITKHIEKALKQLNNQGTALRHLVSDLPLIRITRTLLLPNISSSQLQSALSSSPPLLQAFCRTLSLPADVSRAAGHCMCQEDVEQPDTWWQTLHGSGQDQHMSDDVYRRMVARFCGPATTVDIPTASLPRKVVRSYGEAVAETGLRFSSLTLTPRQVALLNTQPEPRYMYLLGPPGTGKTVVLLLKALQWVQQGRQVVIVSGDHISRAVSLLLEEQLRSMAGPAAANAIQRLCCDFMQDDVQAAVTSLQQVIGPGLVLVICDEFNPDRNNCIQLLTEVRHQLPAVCVWAAGVWKVDRPGREPLPSWVRVETLQEALRCPPSVTMRLRQSSYVQDDNIPSYTDPQVAVSTQGPPVQRLQHEGQPGHSRDHPSQCVACSDCVADILHQLHVGQPGQPLMYRDVLLLYHGCTPCADDIMVRRLRQHHRLPVGVISHPPSEADTRELALAITDQVVVTYWEDMTGLERRVVILLGPVWNGRALFTQSRCSSSLHIID